MSMKVVAESFRRLTDQNPIGPVRFAGYEPDSQHHRRARYEADYPA